MMETSLRDWTPGSWRERPVQQHVPYPEPAALRAACERLATLPPLVTSWEVERLRERLADAAEGRRFMLQGGDCAETFAACTPGEIANKLKIILQMSLVLSQGLKRPIVRVARMAGQYAKPRSSMTESRDGKALPSYFGDLVNGAEFDENARRPDPGRLLQGYAHAAMTLNFARGLTEGGFADLHHPEYWGLDFLNRPSISNAVRESYRRITDSISNAIEFLEAIGERQIHDLARVEFYTSHEGLHLEYEEALTRTVPRRTGYYDLSCHLPWIGERTRAIDGAHVEFFRGLRNPIGVKIGPKTTPAELAALLERLDPHAEPGRMTVIARMGAAQVERALPPLLAKAKELGRAPIWVCDPMHGNTEATASGFKTRRFEAILRETLANVEIHRAAGTQLGGIHVELTGENVRECLGGGSGVTEDDMFTGYESPCDPRLNAEQAMELAFALAEAMQRKR